MTSLKVGSLSDPQNTRTYIQWLRCGYPEQLQLNETWTLITALNSTNQLFQIRYSAHWSRKLLTSLENSLKCPQYHVTTSFHGSVQSYKKVKICFLISIKILQYKLRSCLRNFFYPENFPATHLCFSWFSICQKPSSDIFFGCVPDIIY